MIAALAASTTAPAARAAETSARPVVIGDAPRPAATIADTRPRPTPRVLRVVADPNNLPFSNERREGFENKIVELVAAELNASVEYTWWAQRRGYFRNTIKSGLCDVVPGVPRDLDMALTTAPYYRSTYMWVTRRDRGLNLRSLDDPALRQLRIGIQLVGDDKSAPPAAQALAARGLTANLRGFTVYGEYAEPDPPARIIDAVLRGDVDVAVVWGPLAGFFAKRHHDELDLTPLPPRDQTSAMPLAFDISMGVRRGNRALRDELQQVLQRKRPEIDAILASYGVPRVDGADPLACIVGSRNDGAVTPTDRARPGAPTSRPQAQLALARTDAAD